MRCRSRSGCIWESSSLPLAAEESHDPARDMPRGILLGLLDTDRLCVSHRHPECRNRAGGGEVGALRRAAFLGLPDNLLEIVQRPADAGADRRAPA